MTSSNSGGAEARPHFFGHGRLAYVQIPAVDVQVSAAFYRDMFGWQIRGGSGSHLSFTDTTGDMIGAFVTSRPVSRHSGAVFYVYVHGLDAVLEKMQAAGSTIVKPPYPEGDIWVATVGDPAGNEIGIWQRDPR